MWVFEALVTLGRIVLMTEVLEGGSMHPIRRRQLHVYNNIVRSVPLAVRTENPISKRAQIEGRVATSEYVAHILRRCSAIPYGS